MHNQLIMIDLSQYRPTPILDHFGTIFVAFFFTEQVFYTVKAVWEYLGSSNNGSFSKGMEPGADGEAACRPEDDDDSDEEVSSEEVSSVGHCGNEEAKLGHRGNPAAEQRWDIQQLCSILQLQLSPRRAGSV